MKDKKVIIIDENNVTPDYLKRFLHWKYEPEFSDIIDRTEITKNYDLLIFKPTQHFFNKHLCVAHLSKGLIVINNIKTTNHQH